jgi:hypothetical protein
MKKNIMLVFVIFVTFALIAAPGYALAGSLLEGDTTLETFQIYLPVVLGAPPSGIVLPQACNVNTSLANQLQAIQHVYEVVPYNLSVGYEDLNLNAPSMDFDYNDWVTDIPTSLCFYSTSTGESFMWQIDLAIVPQARGAALDHAYHVDFPANIFPSDGYSILTHYDTAGNVIGAPIVQDFIANQVNEFDLVDPTSLALPGSIVNTRETQPHQITQGFATLTIRFYNAFPFDPSIYDPAQPGNEHGAMLFFQPHLSVYQNPVYDIRPGSPLMLVVPFLDWKWPEERIAIWRAYPNVTPGDTSVTPKVPPQFPLHWETNFNDCVYDGLPCTAPAAAAPSLEPYPAP